MDENVYSTPKADLAVAEPQPAEFYVVGPRKFYLLSALTLNVYLIYWFYRNWSRVKVRTGSDAWPVMRGLFYIFFTFSLFAEVDAMLRNKAKEFHWRPEWLAITFVVLTVASNVLDRLTAKNIGSPATDLVSVALVLLIPAVLLKGQKAINLACDDPDGSGNARLTAANWIWMILGALLWLLTLFVVYAVLFAPELLAA